MQRVTWRCWDRSLLHTQTFSSFSLQPLSILAFSNSTSLCLVLCNSIRLFSTFLFFLSLNLTHFLPKRFVFFVSLSTSSFSLFLHLPFSFLFILHFTSIFVLDPFSFCLHFCLSHCMLIIFYESVLYAEKVE